MTNNDTFGAAANTGTTFGSTATSAPPMMAVSCMDVYSHESKTYQVPLGTTINTFFSDHLKISANADRFNIRVNSSDALNQQALNAGDQILVTPTKIEGGILTTWAYSC